MMAVCLSYGKNKQKEWQYAWLVITILKVAFDLSVKQMLISVIANFTIPNLISEDVKFVRNILEINALKLLRSNVAFHVNEFSATEYIYSSVRIAQTYPNLVESKLVLLYRNAIPE